MHLKSLELQGFKSFLAKTRLDFDHGTTVIVGPNGSGKSNIADAIRWVLGEQSAKTLRGNKMEDVIFAGSEKRKPLGLAEATVTLDNSSGVLSLDYQEIAITRRVLRLGESEYFLNKSPCRLKDISDLFADSGIGKESMSLISQGKVEEVLNSKPEERRALIEETAGIIKYRNRKRDALRKLEETQSSLYRLQDLTAELHRQLVPLAAEAETAQKYLGLKSELDELELSNFLNLLRSLKQRRDTLSYQFTQLQNSLSEAEIIDSELLTKRSALRLKLEEAEKQLGDTQQSLYYCQAKLERLDGQIAVARERKNSLTERRETLKSAKVATQDKLSSWQYQHANQEASYKKLIAGMEKENRMLAKYLFELSNEENIFKKFYIDLEQAKHRMYELASRAANMRNEVLQLNHQGRQVDIKTQKTIEKKTGLSFEIEQAEKYRLGWMEKDRQAKQRMEEIIILLSEINIRKQEKQSEVYEQQKSLQVLEQEMNSLNSKATLLREMAKEGEGLFLGVKTILRAKQQGNPLCREVYGVVADLIKVSYEQEIAIEVALGGALQDLVVETDRGAKACIQLLKEKKEGRATFLPLNTIKPRNLPSQGKTLLGQAGIIGVAAHLVQADAKFQRVLEHLLGNIFVVNDITVGLRIAAETGYAITIVTLDGEMLNPGGSLSGGSLRHKRNSLLSRNRNLAETTEMLDKRISVSEIKRDRLAMAEAELMRETAEWDNLQIELRQLELTVTGNAKEAERLQDGLNRLSMDLVHLELQEEELGIERAGIGARLKIAQQMMSEGEHEEHKLKNKIEQMQFEEQILRSASGTLSEALTETKVRLARLQQEEASLKEGLEQQYKVQEEFLAELARLEEECIEIEQRSAENIKHLASYQKDRGSLMVTRGDLEHDVALKRENLKSCRECLEHLEAESRKAQQRNAELKNMVHQKELEKTRLDGEFQSAKELLQDKWGIEVDLALNIRPGAIPASGFAQRIRQLQQEIACLGQVHIGAIAELKRLEERLSFLCRQNDDLGEAKSTLLKVINEVDQVISKMFLATFRKVADSFAETFCSLFGGGCANLSLTDPNNILETGIEISAQPPGKKLQNLNMLSGGERALTAIALLFAILHSRPSPFCVLDEIDASLDDANVERFAFFLKELSQQTQFIVISHRQKTMETANRLYGISMEEPGISKIISVKLVDGGIAC